MIEYNQDRGATSICTMESIVKPPFISVVIIAHKKVELLQKAITSIVRETFEKNWELLLVRNGDYPPMTEFIRSLERSTSFPLTVISIPEQRPGAARNHAITRAKGEIVFFLDDDIELFQDIFSAARRIFSKPSVMAAGGANLTPPSSSYFERASGLAMASYWGTASMSARYRSATIEHRANEHDLILCNLAVRRSILCTSGRIFPSHFVSNEENIFLQNLEQEGLEMVASPALAVYHKRRSSWQGLAEQCFKYGKGRAQNCIYLPESFRFLYLIPSSFVLFLAMLFVRGSAQNELHFFIWPVLFYCFFCLVFSLKDFFATKSIRIFSLQSFIYLLVHVSYGVGFLQGGFSWAWRRKKLCEVIPREC